MRVAVWLGPLGIAFAAACARDASSSDRLCTPGDHVFCRCQDGSSGTKLCNDDGASFEACSACQPGDEVDGGGEDDAAPREDATNVVDAHNDASPADDSAAADGPEPVDSAPDTSSTAPKPTPGEVLITEVLYDPSGTEPDGEWLELYNTANGPRLLTGLSLKDGANRTFAITTGSLVLDPGAYAVLVRSQAAATTAGVPAGSILLEYGGQSTSSQGIQLANGATGAVWLTDGTTIIGAAAYGGWYSQTSPGGSSVQLKTLTLDASGQKANWCLSANPWIVGSDKGTPGAASDCP